MEEMMRFRERIMERQIPPSVEKVMKRNKIERSDLDIAYFFSIYNSEQNPKVILRLLKTASK